MISGRGRRVDLEAKLAAAMFIITIAGVAIDGLNFYIRLTISFAAKRLTQVLEETRKSHGMHEQALKVDVSRLNREL